MKRLIINADDLGADEPRNAGIFEAIREGTVTSVSIFPNGPALGDALDRLRNLDRPVSLGFHINITEGRPVSSGLKLLTQEDGSFPGKTSMHALLLQEDHPPLRQEIAREISAQIEVLLDAGIQIDHVDGHQHVHLFPAAIGAVVQMGQKYRIPWIRMPEEPPFQSQAAPLTAPVIEEGLRFTAFAGAAKRFLKGTGIRTTDRFLGLYMKGKLSLSLLSDLLQTLPDGVTELMVHPGRIPAFPTTGPFSGFSTRERERELETLLDKDFGRVVSEAGFSLTPFPEISE